MSKQDLIERIETLEAALSQMKEIIEEALDNDEIESDDDEED